MQLYAFDDNHQLISANHAQKQTNYLCLECMAPVRMRGGAHRQNHFYHVSPNHHCSLQGKSMEHLQVQCHLKKIFPEGECELEFRFPEINRIADVVWTKEKLIFEVQCSPIYAQEVQQRIQNYQSLGYLVIWILHDKTFNQFKASAAEHFLADYPHYFTDINQAGLGVIYDQFSILHKGYRKHVLDPLYVDLSLPLRQIDFVNSSVRLPKESLKRIEQWPICFKGDLITLSFADEHYLEKALRREEIIQQKAKKPGLKEWLYWLFVRPYNLLFQMLLEKACK